MNPIIITDKQPEEDREPLHGSIVINEHYKAIPTKYGMMLVNRHEYGLPWSLEEEGEWVPTEIEFLMQFARGIVFDIGANIGTHTLAFARAASHVYSFEPQKLTYYTLCSNLLLNNVFNATPCELALGNYDGSIPMYAPDPRMRNASAGIPVGEGDNQVAIAKLDSLALPVPYFIKIDVEGYELEVLRGGNELLQKNVCFVYVEIHSEELIAPICTLMESLGYRSNQATETRIIKPLDEEDGGKHLFSVYGYLFIGKGVVIV